MSGVYIVFSASNSVDFEVEAHAGFMGAAKRAVEIAKEKCPKHPEWIKEEPSSTKLDDGDLWVFLNTSQTYVAVVYQTIQSPQMKTQKPEFFLDSCGVFKSVKPTTGFIKHGNDPAPAPVPVIFDDPANNDLPGGWDWNNKPITMQFVRDSAYDVKDYDQLSENQKVALVLARINKRPRFCMLVPGIGTFLKDNALLEVKNRSAIGQNIVEQEISWLIDFKNQH